MLARPIRFLAGFICITWGASLTLANEGGMTPRQMEIIQTAMIADGYVNEELHREFWSTIPDDLKRQIELLGGFETVFTPILTAALRFQRETWASIKASMEAGRVVKSPDYEAAKKQALDATPPGPARQQVLPAFQSAERMIASAAKGKPVQTPQGLAYLAPEVVDGTIAGMDAAFVRLKFLLDDGWPPPRKEYRYPASSVAVLSEQPFVPETREMTLPGGQRFRLQAISKRTGPNGYAAIGFGELEGRWIDPEGALMRMAGASVSNTGAETLSLHSELWRDRVTATAAGRADTGQGPWFISVRTLELPNAPGFMVYIFVSGDSLIDAVGRREELEKRSRILSGG